MARSFLRADGRHLDYLDKLIGLLVFIPKEEGNTEAAQQRQDRFNNSAAGKAAAKAAARDKAHTSSAAAHNQRIHDIIN